MAVPDGLLLSVAAVEVLALAFVSPLLVALSSRVSGTGFPFQTRKVSHGQSVES